MPSFDWRQNSSNEGNYSGGATLNSDDMDNNPLVSIVTPSYNQAQFIEATINSVLNQDYAQVEYIIMDGQSTDESPAIIQNYADRLSFWTSRPDQGQADALLKGFAQTHGEIITWLNSDDIYLDSDVISRVVSLFQQHPQADAITGGGLLISESGQRLRQIMPPPVRVNYRELRYRNWLVQPATFFRRQAMGTLPLDPSLHYVFDWDFFIRLAREYNVMVSQEVWTGYRMWGENKTARGDSLRVWELAEVTGRYLGRRSWHYWALRLLYLLNRGGEKALPDILRPPFNKLLRIVSRALNLLSHRRFPLLF